MAVKTKSTDSSYGWVVLAVTFLAGFTAPANMAKVTALAPVVMQTFGFGPDTLGWVIALFYVLGFVMAFPTAGLINKLGIRNVVLIAIGCAAVGSAMGALTENVTVFMVSRFLEGAGMGVMGVAGASAIAPWFAPEKRGFPLGIWAMWVALAMCICPVLYGYVVDTLALPWQTVWWGTFVFDIVVGIVFVVFYREPERPYQTEEDQVSGKADFKRALKNPMLWALGMIFFFDEAAFMAINGFLTTYLTEQLATTLVWATGIASAFGVAGAICAPLCGKISDWLKTRKWVLLFALIGGVAYTAVVFTCQVPAAVLGHHDPRRHRGRLRALDHLGGHARHGRPRRRPRGERARGHHAEPRHVRGRHVHGQRRCGVRMGDGIVCRARAMLPHLHRHLLYRPAQAALAASRRCTAETVPFEGPFLFQRSDQVRRCHHTVIRTWSARGFPPYRRFSQFAYDSQPGVCGLDCSQCHVPHRRGHAGSVAASRIVRGRAVPSGASRPSALETRKGASSKP